jgi:hypothetical protein
LVLYPTVTVYLPDEPYQDLESELLPKIGHYGMCRLFPLTNYLRDGTSFSPTMDNR